MKLHQKWEGWVVEVLPNAGTFVARLIPVVGDGGDLEAEILISAVDEDQRQYVRENALFEWSISSNGMRGTEVEVISRFVFKASAP